MAVSVWRILRSATTLLLLPAAASAQGLSISGHMGQYAPTEPVYEVARAGAAGPVGKYKLNSTTTTSAAITLWLGDRFGLSVAGGMADTRLAYRGIEANSVTTDLGAATLQFGHFQGIGVTAGPASVLQPYFSAGVAYIRRGGPVFEGRDDNGLVGFTLGAGLRVKVARALLTGGIEVLDYSGKYKVNNGPVKATLQRDIQLRGGIEVPLFGR